MDPDYRPLSRRIAWLAADSDGNPVGSAFLRLNSRQEQAHLAEFELNVHPAERRRGIGTLLLDAVVSAAREHEVEALVADVNVDTDGVRFLEHHGFSIGLTLIYAAGADRRDRRRTGRARVSPGLLGGRRTGRARGDVHRRPHRDGR